jgi:TatD DNase family protein
MSADQPPTRVEHLGDTNDRPAERLTFVDTHCHLDQPQFDQDREQVIARAKRAGVRLIVNPAVDLKSCRNVLDLAERHAHVYAAVGIHPNDCAGFDEATLVSLREMARHPKVVAIGEIGLDYYWQSVPPEQQKVALRAQLRLAADLDRPVILHSREASADLLWELEQWGSTVRTQRSADGMLGVLHAFSGDLADAERAYGLGHFLSLGGPVTFQNARRLHALVPQLRRDRLMLETDAPYLAPHPYRGRRNEPGYLPLIAQSMAALMNATPDALAKQTTETARRLFGLTQ